MRIERYRYQIKRGDEKQSEEDVVTAYSAQEALEKVVQALLKAEGVTDEGHLGLGRHAVFTIDLRQLK